MRETDTRTNVVEWRRMENKRIHFDGAGCRPDDH